MGPLSSLEALLLQYWVLVSFQRPPSQVALRAGGPHPPAPLKSRWMSSVHGLMWSIITCLRSAIAISDVVQFGHVDPRRVVGPGNLLEVGIDQRFRRCLKVQFVYNLRPRHPIRSVRRRMGRQSRCLTRELTQPSLFSMTATVNSRPYLWVSISLRMWSSRSGFGQWCDWNALREYGSTFQFRPWRGMDDRADCLHSIPEEIRIEQFKRTL